jgi:very-short-patch-repair endonuclease
LPEHRIIIEVQGEQHLSFLPYFHGSVENFEYQCWKDQYKKAFAQQKGYQVIYIDYHDIHTDHYKKIINDAILLSRN